MSFKPLTRYQAYWRLYDAENALTGTSRRTRAPRVFGFLLFHLWTMITKGTTE